MDYRQRDSRRAALQAYLYGLSYTSFSHQHLAGNSSKIWVVANHGQSTSRSKDSLWGPEALGSVLDERQSSQLCSCFILMTTTTA